MTKVTNNYRSCLRVNHYCAFVFRPNHGWYFAHLVYPTKEQLKLEYQWGIEPSAPYWKYLYCDQGQRVYGYHTCVQLHGGFPDSCTFCAYGTNLSNATMYVGNDLPIEASSFDDDEDEDE